MDKNRRRIWIDMDNSPHVPFFRPIIEELRKQDCSLLLTARDAFQVVELAKLHQIPCKPIGRHYGKNKLMKILGLLVRSAQLLPHVLRYKPLLAVSHGSRAQTMTAKLVGVPSMVIADYEHVKHVTHPEWAIFPEVIPAEVAGKLARRILTYPGIKEDVYVARFEPNPAILHELGVKESEILVTFRPPATEAHYHNPESEQLFAAAMTLLGEAENVRTVLLPRNSKQELEIRRRWEEYFRSDRMLIPAQAVDGLNLIWHSDLVISGGGTMNREAAALAVPVYSIFRGKMGAVDRYLSANGRLVMLASIDDVKEKIALVKKGRSPDTEPADRPALHAIVNGILTALGR